MSKKYKVEEVNELIRSNRREASEEAQQIGFDLGRQAQAEQYALLEKPICKEATHNFKCPSCKSDMHIPCVNYTLANKEWWKRRWRSE